MPVIHVHVHDQPKAALLRAPTRDCGCHGKTRDADEGEGKWVTINGAHVHIGKGGAIDKGPKELVGKTEHGANAHHHAGEDKKHSEAAKAKTNKHGDYIHHFRASMAHGQAARHFQNAERSAAAGNIKEAAASHKLAEGESARAAEHAGKVGSKEAPKKQAFKPDSHKALHADAEDDVKGSEKHEAEHKRLMKQYDNAETDWQRHAINNQVTKNANDGAQANAQSKHHKALAASEYAKKTNDPEHHRAAMNAIDEANEAHGKAGGDGVKAKQKELETMRKGHSREVEKHAKAQAKNVKPMTDDEHRAEAMRLRKAGNHSEAKKHDEAIVQRVRSHHEAMAKKHGDEFGKNATAGGMPKTREAAQHQKAMQQHQYALTALNSGDHQDHHGHQAKANKLSAELEAKDPKQHKPMTSHGKPARKSSHGGSSALEKLAAKHLKKAAEEAADQDPKHKK